MKSNNNIEIKSLNNSQVLTMDGVVQSVYPSPDWGYWKHMMPDFEPKNVLMLGVGAGTIAEMIKDKWPNTEITGIDNSLSMAERGRNKVDYFILADAFYQIYQDEMKYDLILVDLWNGGWYPTQVFKPEFISQLKRLLTPKGKIYINAPDFEKHALANNLKVKAKSDGANIIYETA